MTAIHQFVEECRAGTLARCLKRMKSGWAVLGDPQIREGYCLLYSDPVVPDLNHLDAGQRAQFLMDMAAIGDAVLAVTNAARINYEILGNQEPALHAHIIPRWEDELPDMKTKPIWFDRWESAARFDPALHQEVHAALLARLGHD